MADVLLVLAIASYMHYFGIFTFHTEHYWSLLFLLFSVEFFFSYWSDRVSGKSKKEKGEKNDNRS